MVIFSSNTDGINCDKIKSKPISILLQLLKLSVPPIVQYT